MNWDSLKNLPVLEINTRYLGVKIAVPFSYFESSIQSTDKYTQRKRIIFLYISSNFAILFYFFF